jgi:hypothetical protein
MTLSYHSQTHTGQAGLAVMKHECIHVVPFCILVRLLGIWIEVYHCLHQMVKGNSRIVVPSSGT